MVGRNFIDNRCFIRASALAYTTLLALVPLLAVGISFATSFLKGERGQQQIKKLIDMFLDKAAPQIGLVAQAGDTESRAKAVEFINSAIQTISSGALGITATIALIFAAISLLSSIEGTFNDIWGVRQGRSWISSIPTYFTAIALGGLILMATALNAGPYFEATHRLLENMSVIGNLIYDLLPALLLIVILGFFYQLMPNTRVDWKAALVGGIAAGLLLHLNNSFSTIYFSQVVRNSKIYGSLGILPVLLIGLYFSWVIVLFGAQVSYAFQNRKTYLQERQADKINQRGREFVALRLMTLIAQRFHGGESPLAVPELSNSLAISTRLIQKILEPLLQSNLLIEVAGKEPAYVPSRPIDKINYNDILDSMRAGQGQEIATRDEPARELVRGELDKIRRAERTLAQTATLAQMVEQLQTSPYGNRR